MKFFFLTLTSLLWLYTGCLVNKFCLINSFFINHPTVKTMLFYKCLPFLFVLIYKTQNINALVEDVIDILHLGREVIKTISSSWELADQVGVTNEIDLPFMKRKEKKILNRMHELSQEFKNAEMQVSFKEISHNFHNLIKKIIKSVD